MHHFDSRVRRSCSELAKMAYGGGEQRGLIQPLRERGSEIFLDAPRKPSIARGTKLNGDVDMNSLQARSQPREGALHRQWTALMGK